MPKKCEFWFCDPCFDNVKVFLKKIKMNISKVFLLNFERNVLEIKNIDKLHEEMNLFDKMKNELKKKTKYKKKKPKKKQPKKNGVLKLPKIPKIKPKDLKFSTIINKILSRKKEKLFTKKIIQNGFPKCILCGLKTGPMLKTDISKNDWAHLSCAYWIKEIGIDLENRLICVQHLKTSLSLIKCIYCNHKLGLTTRCHEIKCNHYFHIECARRLLCELLLPYQFNSKQSYHIAFCIDHSKTYTTRKLSTLSANFKFRCPIFLRCVSENHFEHLHRDPAFLKKRLRKEKVKVILEKKGKVEGDDLYRYVGNQIYY